MPVVKVADGTEIAYSTWGNPNGEPLLMIQGLGADTRGWIMQRGALGRRHRMILVDNRGVGRSGRPDGPYDLEVMAADAIAALDHAGYGSAHVIGASMGGIISQIIGVRHPERVRSLTLACTSCHHYSWRRELLATWSEYAQAHGMRAFVLENMEWLVGPRTLRRLWPAMAVLGPLAFNVAVESFVAQVEAILAMDDSLRDELTTIDAPTLVMCGSQDVLTTQGDTEEIGSLIPGSEVVVVRGGAHVFMVEQAGAFNRTVLDFLATVNGQSGPRLRPGSAPAEVSGGESPSSSGHEALTV